MQPAFKDNPPFDRAGQIAREYEDFAYIVSHDLNAPLRHIREFTRLLIGSRTENLTSEEQEYIGYLESALKKVDDMQNALLSFSRIDTCAEILREVDLDHLVADVLEEFSGIIKEQRVSIERSKLPIVMGDSKQMHLLFYHLIGNAMKFHPEGASNRKISISSANLEDAWYFEVKDNGVGIPKENYEEVFRLFKRLDPEKYPGIGAGLTLVRKIVQRHGGEVIINSRPGQGTSVFFSIKK